MPIWLVTLLAKILQPVIETVLKNIGLYFDEKKIQTQEAATDAAMDESKKAVTSEDRKKAIHDLSKSLND